MQHNCHSNGHWPFGRNGHSNAHLPNDYSNGQWPFGRQSLAGEGPNDHSNGHLADVGPSGKGRRKEAGAVGEGSGWGKESGGGKGGGAAARHHYLDNGYSNGHFANAQPNGYSNDHLPNDHSNGHLADGVIGHLAEMVIQRPICQMTIQMVIGHLADDHWRGKSGRMII